ncbi:MAG: UPF0182 family protein [Acidimicrobiales bacterium]
MANAADAAVPQERRLSPRSRAVVAVAVAALVLLFMSLRGIARFYTDFLWFDSLGLGSVWTGVLGAKVALGLIFTSVFFALLWVNLLIADRLAPRYRPTGPEEDLLARYYDLIGRRGGMLRFMAALLFALIAGAGVSQQWQSWVLFTNRVDFGETDPLHGVEVGFYVFQLPFLRFLVGWLFLAFVIILIVTLVAHYLNGGIRVQTPAQRVTASVKGHLSVLLAVLAIIKAADYLLQRYALTLSTRGFVQGASYADVNAKLPALNLLMAISLLSVALFLVNIRRRGWTLPVVAVGSWAFAAVVVGTSYPWFVQRFSVERGESSKERPYIERNIEATLKAYAMDGVVVKDFEAGANLSAQDVAEAASADVFRNVGLLDPGIISEVLNRQQAQTGWLSFPAELDNDRYMVDGRETLTVIGARGLNANGVPQKSWEGLHLIYTQGYGAVLAAAGQVREGGPSYLVSGVGPNLTVNEDAVDVELTQPRLYFGEDMDGYAIVKNSRPEIAYENDDFRYDGTGGVVLGSFLRRCAFALRYGDLDPVLSGFVTDESRMLYVRDVRERVQSVAPFLSFDSDPYPVLAEGRIIWVIDGYTTTDSYPYGQAFDGENLPAESGLRRQFNYVRNSVKATVDGYDGTVSFYLNDVGGQSDPLARAYQQAFPELFKPLADMPASVQAHLRHPQDLFRVQTTMFASYHVTDPTQFYNQVGRWAVADQPDREVNLPAVASATTAPPNPALAGGLVTTNVADGERVEPQYQMLRLPDEEDVSFVVTRPFVPISDRQRQKRETLTAFMSANPDGSLQLFRVSTEGVVGPTLLTSRILSDDAISRDLSLLANRQTGSIVQLGARVMLPIEQSLLWVTPMYVTAAAGSSSSVPELNSVILGYGERVVRAETLTEALTELFGTEVDFNTLHDGSTGGTTPSVPDPPVAGGPTTTAPGPPSTAPGPGPSTPTTEGPGGPTTTTTPTDEAALTQAAVLLQEADAALRNGDLAGYQAKVKAAKALLDAQVERNLAPTTTRGQA